MTDETMTGAMAAGAMVTGTMTAEAMAFDTMTTEALEAMTTEELVTLHARLLAQLRLLPEETLVSRKGKNGHVYYSLQKMEKGLKKDRYLSKKELSEVLPLFEEKTKIKRQIREIRICSAKIPGYTRRLKAKQKVLDYPFWKNYVYYVDGIYVESRAEVIIVQILRKHRVKFEYGEFRSICGEAMRPDFTIRVKNKIIFYEHLGMLDKEAYRLNWENKLRKYEAGGYFEGKNLIVTRDVNGYIDTMEIEMKLREAGVI